MIVVSGCSSANAEIFVFVYLLYVDGTRGAEVLPLPPLLLLLPINDSAKASQPVLLLLVVDINVVGFAVKNRAAHVRRGR